MIAPFLLCVFAACFSKFVYGKLYNPSTVFFLIWMLLLAFSRLGLFGVPVPNSDTYLLLFIGLFSFFVGFVSVDLKKWFGRKNIFFRKFESDVKYLYVLNFKIVIVLYSITFVYLAYQAVIVIGLLQSGLTLSAIRELFTSSDLNLLRQSNYMVAIQNFIATPTVYLAIAILPIEWFKGNRNKIFIVSTILMIIAWVLTSGGRSVILWMAIYVIYLYKWKGVKIKLKKENRRKIVLVVLSCIISLIFTTISRKGENVDFFFQMYQYFVVPIAHLEYRINELNASFFNVYGYGMASFYGVFYPFMFILTLAGWKYPIWLTTIRDLSFMNLENVVLLGSARMNAFVTTFFQFYLDGGMFGVFVGGVLFGFFVMHFYKKAKNGTDDKYTLIYLLLLQKLIFSFVRFYFTQPVQGISFLMAFFVYKRIRL